MHLPVYAFEKTKYWLPGVFSGKKMDMPVTAKQWIFIREQWVSRGFAEDVNWTNRLQQYAGKRFCIVYEREEGMK